MTAARQVLAEVFGFPGFRPGQEAMIHLPTPSTPVLKPCELTERQYSKATSACAHALHPDTLSLPGNTRERCIGCRAMTR